MTLRGVALTLDDTVFGLDGCSQEPPLPFPLGYRRPARAQHSP